MKIDYRAFMLLTVVALVLSGCPQQPPGDEEPTNPNVSISLTRGAMTLLASKDRIRFPDTVADGASGVASPSLSFTVTNTGTESLTIYRIEAVSGDVGDFAVTTSSLATTVAPGGSTSFGIAFNPLTAGSKAAAVLVVTNAGTANRYELAAYGTALPSPVNAADTTIHAFVVKTSGNLTVAPRAVIPGNVVGAGGVRIICGCGQNPGPSQGSHMTVFKRKVGGTVWEYEFEREIIFTADALDMFEPLLAFDFDGNGVDEMFCKLNQSPAFVRWNGTTYEQCWISESALIACDYGVALADVDRDGQVELITGNGTSTCVYSWDAGFTNFAKDATLTGGSYFSVGVGDIDGDGFLEIATSTVNTKNVYVYRYDGASYSLLHTGEYSSTTGYAGFAAADLDGDFVDELVGASMAYSASQYYISLFEWGGTSLSESILATDTSGKYGIAVGDFDRDGREEAIVDQNGPQCMMVEDSPTGIHATSAGIDYYMFMTPLDWDSDGFPELFVTDVSTTDSAFLIKDEVSNP